MRKYRRDREDHEDDDSVGNVGMQVAGGNVQPVMETEALSEMISARSGVIITASVLR